MSNKTDENGEELKIFTMRNVPETLRKRWKVVCTLESITMEEFAVLAIQEKVNRYNAEKLKELVEREQREQREHSAALVTNLEKSEALDETKV